MSAIGTIAAAPSAQTSAGAEIHAAERSRDLSLDATGAQEAQTAQPAQPAPSVTTAPPAHPHEQTVEPDLDALARQVYTVLRRRLATEQRRLG
jgi:hypothetical protein